MIEIVRRASENAEEMVVAALERAEVRQIAEMPFADEGRAVACLLEQRRQGRVAGRQTDAFRRRWIDRFLEPHRKTHLIASGNQPRACRRATRRIRIGLRKFYSLDRDPVDVRRRVVALAVATHISVAEVIRQDEDDVRPGSLRLTCATKTGQSQRACGSRLHEPATGQRVLIMGHVLLSGEKRMPIY
jgi:hypothetical protein